MLTIMAPAKLNLTLEVLGKRPDGFHDIRTVIQTISLCDELRFRLSHNVEVKSNLAEWNVEWSLVAKAAGLLRRATGCSQGAIIEVTKRIPLVSGLGGDSSDAAAVLRGLNQLWGLGLSLEELVKLADKLGSDVPFFIYGGTALVEGRGEKVTPLSPLPLMWAVLVVPSVPKLQGKTGQLYASLEPSHYTDGQITERLVEALRGGKEFTPAYLFNTFENVAFTLFSGLDEYRECILEDGADNVHLAGSGPTLFSLAKGRAQAEELYSRLKKQGLEAYMAESSSSGT